VEEEDEDKCLRFWHRQVVSHVLDLLKVVGHVGCEDYLDDETAKLSTTEITNYQHHLQSSLSSTSLSSI